jgi:Tol biopolymer transport system component
LGRSFADQKSMKTKALITVSILVVLLVSCVRSNHLVVYSASSDEKSVNLYLVNTDSGENQQITNLEYANYASWSPDGKRIVFSSNNGLYFINTVNKTDLTKIIDTPNFEIHPNWSPEGSKIAFISQNVDNASLYDLMVVNVDGTGLITLATNLGEIDYFSSFSWSPDGERITFSNPVDESREIFTISVDGTGLQQVTNLSAPPNSPPIHPAWSPDGKKIAFVTWDLLIVNSDGTELDKLVEKTEGISIFGAPQWSPDGKYIACQNGDNIVLVGATNKQIATITAEKPISGHAWSPQGDDLVYFVHNGNGTLNIEKIDVSSMQRVQITKNLGSYPWQSLSWQP